MDLAATNIVRGRDHGIPSYAEYRKYCELSLVNNFEDLKYIMPEENIRKLKSVYTSVNDIDLWVGGLAETDVEVVNRFSKNSFRNKDSVVGPTFQCLMEKQILDLKKGDRFFYENAPDATLGTSSTAFTIGNQI